MKYSEAKIVIFSMIPLWKKIVKTLLYDNLTYYVIIDTSIKLMSSYIMFLSHQHKYID